jgi:hypothetical protein
MVEINSPTDWMCDTDNRDNMGHATTFRLANFPI